MAKIPKNLSDKEMFVGFKEEKTFEHTFLEADTQIEDKPAIHKKKEKEDLSTAFLTKELQEKIGKALLELKLDLFKEGLVEYDLKVTREGKKIVLSAVASKKKNK